MHGYFDSCCSTVYDKSDLRTGCYIQDIHSIFKYNIHSVVKYRYCGEDVRNALSQKKKK